MWKVGGTKIERTRARHIFLCVRTEICEKILGKTLRTQKFLTGKFFRAATNGILTPSGFRKYSQFEWPSLRFEVKAAQSRVKGQKLVMLQITLKLIDMVVMAVMLVRDQKVAKIKSSSCFKI